MHKRTFLKFLASSSVVALLPNILTGCSRDSFMDVSSNIVMGGGKYADPNELTKVNYALSIINLTMKKKKLIPINFLAHGVIIDPKNYFRAILFEKIGPGACEIDLHSMKMTNIITTNNEKYFYGHGAFSIDAKYIFCTETYLNNKKGIIAIRDADTMQYLGEFPTYGDNPHECKLTDNGKTMVVTNAGSSIGGNIMPSVTYIDMASQQLKERVLLTNKRLNTGHMAIGNNGSLVVASAPREGLSKTDLGGVSIRPTNLNMQSISLPSDIVNSMKGEALSVIIHNKKDIAAVTHPDGNMVTFWSVKDRTLLNHIKIEKPRGVTLTNNEKTFLISYGQDTNLISIDVDSMTVNSNALMKYTYLTGSHIYNWSKTLKEILPIGAMA